MRLRRWSNEHRVRSMPCDARRTAAAPNSHVPVLKHAALSPPSGCASRHRQRRIVASKTAIHGLHLQSTDCITKAAARQAQENSETSNAHGCGEFLRKALVCATQENGSRL